MDAINNEGGPTQMTSSEGATYHNGVYYLAGEYDNSDWGGSTDGYYRCVMGPYVPGSGVQQITNVTYIKWSDNKGAVETVIRISAGSGYNNPPYENIPTCGGCGTGLTGSCAPDGGGGIDGGTLEVYNAGSGYTTNDTVGVVGGSGFINVDTLFDEKDNRSMGDMAYNHNSGMLMISSNNVNSSHPSSIAICDPSSGVIHHSEPFTGDMLDITLNHSQITWDASGAIIVSGYETGGVDTHLYSINTQSGYCKELFPEMVGNIYDLAEYISQPCGLGT